MDRKIFQRFNRHKKLNPLQCKQDKNKIVVLYDFQKQFWKFIMTMPWATAFTPASEDLTIVDNKLFKAICLQQILDPTKGGNRYYRLLLMALMCFSLSVQIMQLVGLYFAVHDLQRFAFTTTTVSHAFLCMTKGYMLLTHADRLRACLEVARYEFTSCGARDQSIVRRSRAVLSTILRTFAVLSWFTCFIWVLTPLFVMDDYLQVTNADDTVSRYRITIFNMWLPVPVAVYNATPIWALVYMVEVIACLFTSFSFLLFDSYVVTMCFTFNAQFRTVSTSCAKIGHRDCIASLSPQAMGSCPVNCYYY